MLMHFRTYFAYSTMNHTFRLLTKWAQNQGIVNYTETKKTFSKRFVIENLYLLSIFTKSIP